MADNRNDYTDVKFSQTQKNMYNGFSEDLYGNNWFILTTNDIGKGGFGNGRSSSICGVLNSIPKLTFKTDIVDGAQKSITDLVTGLINTKRGSAIGAVGSALGINLNQQLAGNFTRRVYSGKSFLEDGITLEFDCWKDPAAIFDDICLPSDQSSVVSYLTKFATVETANGLYEVLDRKIEQTIAGAASIVPVGKKALSDAGKVLLGYDNQAGEDDLFDKIGNFAKSITTAADTLLVRGWNDKQRISIGREKFNECLHRLDIMRAGVLDTYLIVAVDKWNYELDQDSLGEKMKVQISLKLDQRMNRDRLSLYSERGTFK